MKELKAIETIIWIAFTTMVILFYALAFIACDEANINTLREEIRLKENPEAVKWLIDGNGNLSAVRLRAFEVPEPLPDISIRAYATQNDLLVPLSRFMNGANYYEAHMVIIGVFGKQIWDSLIAGYTVYLVREDFKR